MSGEKISQEDFETYINSLVNDSQAQKFIHVLREYVKVTPELIRIVLPRAPAADSTLTGHAIWLGRAAERIFTAVETIKWPGGLPELEEFATGDDDHEEEKEEAPPPTENTGELNGRE